MNTTAQAAIAYTRAGWALVPIAAGSKGPRTAGWQTQPAAITTPEQAATLTGNVGLAHRWCGTCVVDVDDYERAEPWLNAEGIALAELLAAPDAVQIVSGRANRAKLLYRLPQGVPWLPSLKEADDALELRCASRDGAATVQDVLPPSIHPDTGKPYAWGGGGDWRSLPVLPAALLALWQALAKPAPGPRPERQDGGQTAADSGDAHPFIQEGGRNQALASLAGTMRKRGMSTAAIEAALLAHNLERCNPPLPDEAVRRIAQSVGRYAPGQEPPPMPAASGTPDWRTPQALPAGLPDVPLFDPALVPDSLRPWLLDVAQRMQCPLDFPAVGAMVALGAVVGQRLRIRPKRRDNWQEAGNLWGGIIGRPGAMKSPALGEALKPLRGIEGRALDEAMQKAEIGAVEGMAWDAREKALKAELERAFKPVAEKEDEASKPKRGSKGGGRALDTIKQELLTVRQGAAEAVVQARAVRFTTTDCTIEKLGEILAENPHGILMNRDELVGFLRNMDKSGHESDRAFYLEAWNASGGRFIYDRIARGTVVIESPCVSVLGGTQPGVIGQYVREAASNGVGADGLMQRFQLLVWPDDCKDWEYVDRWGDTPARQAARAVYERLAALDAEGMGAECENGDGRYFLRFAADAQEQFAEWLTALEAELRSPQPDCLNGHFSKYRKLVPALALLCHLADAPQGGPVSLVALTRAMAWAEYLKPHAMRIYAPALGGSAGPAMALAEHIRARELKDGFTARTVYLKGWQGLDKDNTCKALELLEELDWLIASEQPRKPVGGRPALPTYAINPGIWEAGV